MIRRLIASLATALGIVTALAMFPAARAAATLPPLAAAQESFDVGMLHVDKYGSGAQSMILIPGLGCGPWEWAGTIAHFSPNYTIYVLTLAGFDGRPASATPQPFTSFSTDFWTLLDGRKIDKPIVVGHSLGGTLSFLLAEQHPERLRAIVSVDGLPIFPLVATQSPQQREATAQQTALAIANETPEQFLAYEKRFMATIGTRNADLVDPTAELEAKSDPKAVAAWIETDIATDLRPNLSKIAVPVLEIVPYDPVAAKAMGGFSQDQGIAFYRQLIPGVPKLDVVAIAPARHFTMLDQPDAFYAAVTQFLASQPS